MSNHDDTIHDDGSINEATNRSSNSTTLSSPACSWRNGRDRIVVSTSRCGRDNPGSNPGHGRGCEVSIMAYQSAFFRPHNGSAAVGPFLNHNLER